MSKLTQQMFIDSFWRGNISPDGFTKEFRALFYTDPRTRLCDKKGIPKKILSSFLSVFELESNVSNTKFQTSFCFAVFAPELEEIPRENEVRDSREKPHYDPCERFRSETEILLVATHPWMFERLSADVSQEEMLLPSSRFRYELARKETIRFPEYHYPSPDLLSDESYRVFMEQSILIATRLQRLIYQDFTISAIDPSAPKDPRPVKYPRRSGMLA